MMHWRKGGGGFGRFFSAYVALVLMIAVVSPGMAVHAEETVPPQGPENTGAVAPAPEVLVPEPPATEAATPTTSPVEEVAKAVPAAPSAITKQRRVAVPVAQIPAPAPAATPAESYPYAAVGAVQLEGWTRAPHEKWVNGDVKGYFEGEWILFRLTIDNTKGNDVTVQVPAMIYKVDHINGGAVAIDKTAGWRWQIGSGAVTAYTPTIQDSNSNPMYLETQLPEAAGFVIPKGEVGYIYFEGHLALTAYWTTQTPSYLGASGYPGSSAQARLVSWNGINIGDRTVPFPVAGQTAPNGQLSGLKFEDLNGNGTKEAGENPLAGWEFHLTYLDPTYSFTLTATSGADGTFSFRDLPPGDYMLSEVQHGGYTLTTDLSQPIHVGICQTVGPIKVGNRRPDVTKTFALTVAPGAPAAQGYFVRYTVGTAVHDLPLPLAGGVYTAQAVLPYDTTIASWQFFATMGADQVALSPVLGPETLTGPLTNPFTYVPGQISGHKYSDLNGDGTWGGDEPSLEGWTIRLYRALPIAAGADLMTLADSGWDLIAETVTGADGSYSFGGLLPGLYRVEEVEQPGWVMTAHPADIPVNNETAVTDADFGNHEIIYNKTFELTYHGAPAGTTFSVAFLLNGEPTNLDLEGTGPFTASVPVPYPWQIGPVMWYAHVDGAAFVLGETSGETLEGDATNSFTYTATVSGFKFSDDDGNGVWDSPAEVGLPGWTIGLYRQSEGQVIPSALPAPEAGFILAGSTVTGADGSYSFSGLLPGTYYVAEDQQDGWTMTVGPVGTFKVANGSALANLNFGNQEPFLPFTDIEFSKSANKTSADPGDLITYTLTYKNIGDGVIDTVTIVDDYDQRYMTPVDVAGATVAGGKLAWIDTVPLGPGEQRSIVYTMRVAEDMPVGLTHVDNVAVVTPGGHKATWRVDVTVDEPFLPFTGGDSLVLLLVAAVATLAGVTLRRLARVS